MDVPQRSQMVLARLSCRSLLMSHLLLAALVDCSPSSCPGGGIGFFFAVGYWFTTDSAFESLFISFELSMDLCLYHTSFIPEFVYKRYC